MLICNLVQKNSDSIKIDFNNKIVYCKDLIVDPTLDCPLKIDVKEGIIHTDYLIEGCTINVEGNENFIDDSIRISQPILPLLLYRLKYIKSVTLNDDNRESYKGHYFFSNLKDPLGSYAFNPNYGKITSAGGSSSYKSLDLTLKENQFTIYRADYLKDSSNTNPPDCIRLDITEWVNVAFSIYRPFYLGQRKGWTGEEIKKKIIEGLLGIFTSNIWEFLTKANTKDDSDSFEFYGGYEDPTSEKFEGIFAGNPLPNETSEVPYLYSSESTRVRQAYLTSFLSYALGFFPVVDEESSTSYYNGEDSTLSFCYKRPGSYIILNKDSFNYWDAQSVSSKEISSLHPFLKGKNVIPARPRIYIDVYKDSNDTPQPCLKFEYRDPTGLSNDGDIKIQYKAVDSFLEDLSMLDEDSADYFEPKKFPNGLTSETRETLFDKYGKLREVIYARSVRTLYVKDFNFEDGLPGILGALESSGCVKKDSDTDEKYINIYSEWTSFPSSYSYKNKEEGTRTGDYIKICNTSENYLDLELNKSENETVILEGNFIK